MSVVSKILAYVLVVSQGSYYFQILKFHDYAMT